ncbi:MAG: hypothetical protein JNK15_20785 [Planctomycetes bacterium]|nr:hypothetical protein [Planctomycetota bacterium]
MIRSAVALLVLGVIVPAQSGADQAKAAAAEHEALAAAWKAETQASRDAQAKVRATDEFKAAQQAKDSEKMRELLGAVPRPDAKKMGEKALALADQFGDDGVRFLAFAMQANDKEVAAGIVERVTKNHIKNPNLGELLERPSGLLLAVSQADMEALLGKIAAENPSDQVKALAMYTQSTLLTRGKPTEEQKQQAEALLAAAEKIATGDLADRIAAPRFQKERLQIGKECPDIVGEDVDGVAFKLGDYRGKVVVLDFWGFW